MNTRRTKIVVLFAGVFALCLPSATFSTPRASSQATQPPSNSGTEGLGARINEMAEEQKRLTEQLKETEKRLLDAEKHLLRQIEQTMASTPPLQQAPSGISSHTEPRAVSTRDWMLGGTAAFASALCVILLLRMRRPEAADKLNLDDEAETSVPAPDADATLIDQPPPTVTSPVSPPTKLALPVLPDWDPASPALDLQAVKMLAPEERARNHDATIELAEIMLSFGRINSAAEALTGFIENNPKEAFAPWLKLLEVYRASGQRAEFDRIVQKLNRTFNVWTVDWDNFNDTRSPSHSIEAMSHVMRRLQQLWGTRECQAYLQYLLRDTRDETRRGFPLAVICDILDLSDILEYRLGPYTGPTASLGDNALDDAPVTETEGEELAVLVYDSTQTSPAGEDSPETAAAD